MLVPLVTDNANGSRPLGGYGILRAISYPDLEIGACSHKRGRLRMRSYQRDRSRVVILKDRFSSFAQIGPSSLRPSSTRGSQSGNDLSLNPSVFGGAHFIVLVMSLTHTLHDIW